MWTLTTYESLIKNIISVIEDTISFCSCNYRHVFYHCHSFPFRFWTMVRRVNKIQWKLLTFVLIGDMLNLFSGKKIFHSKLTILDRKIDHSWNCLHMFGSLLIKLAGILYIHCTGLVMLPKTIRLCIKIWENQR